LRPFEPEEDHLFFGREKEIDELLRRLRTCRLLSVVGTSGSGKSSLVHSGLIPSLHSGYMVKAGSSWRIAMLRPGEDPIGHLAAALDSPEVLRTNRELATTNRVLLEATLRRGTRGLVETVRQAGIPSGENLLIVVDQFEELFRFRQSRQVENSGDEAVAFVKLLLEAAQQDDFSIYVVLTMRSDFIGDCMEYPGLPEAVNSGQYLVPRMTRDELRSAITGPVAVGGGKIAPRLILRLLNDFGGDHDQLPVLQHALMRTWEHWQAHRQAEQPLDISDYEAIGTIREALSLHAEEAYQETGTDSNKKLAERIFKALTDTFSDPRGVRRPTSVRELAGICRATESEAIEVIEIFRRPGRSFLVPPSRVPLDSRSIIDVAHESLMRCWSRLIAWAEEERASASSYVRLSQAATWYQEGTAGLWRDPELELGLVWQRQNQPTAAWAERYDSHFALAIEFLERSEKERERAESERERERKTKLRQTQWAAGILGILLVAALSLAYLAWRASKRADDNLETARKAVDESLATASLDENGRGAYESPELAEFRRKLLVKAKTFYETLTQRDSGNARLRKEAAQGHVKLGDIDRLLEDYEAAVKEYKEAITDFGNLARLHPAKAEDQQMLANSHAFLAETLRLWMETQMSSPYRPADAEKEYDEALRLQQELYQLNPENSGYQQELARTYYNRAILQYDNKNFEKSESGCRAAIKLLQPLAGRPESLVRNGSNPLPSQELARVYNNLGNLLRHQGKISEGIELLESAVKIDERLTKSNPENREYKLELAKYYDNLALQLWYDDKNDEAQQRNHQAVDLMEELVSPAGSLNTERARMHMIYGMLGSQSNTQKAGNHPEFHVLYRNLAYSYVDIARQNLKSDNPGGAEEALKCLLRVLPQVSQEERKELVKTYVDLESELTSRKAHDN
jgi:tetratricopeptide (TPR) repeat protein